MPKRRRTEWPPPPPPGEGEVALRVLDEDALSRQAEYGYKSEVRRRYKSEDEMCGTGNREGSWSAMTRINKLLTPCGACSTLCSWPRVLRAADREDGAAIAPAHGCAAPGCGGSRWHKPPRHAATQRRWAAELRAGERMLVARPTHAEQPNARRITGDELEGVIDAALALLPAGL